MSKSFVALYRGPTIASAQLIAVSADPSLIALVVSRLLHLEDDPGGDLALDSLSAGRRTALRLVLREAEGEDIP